MTADHRGAGDKLTGYADALVAAPGERLRFMVSSPEPYEAGLVRLLHGDTSADGPGSVEEPITGYGSSHAARLQGIDRGSYAVARESASSPTPDALSLAVRVYATRPGGRKQALLARWLESPGSSRGYGLFLMPEGDVALIIGGHTAVRTERALAPRMWHLVIATFERLDGVAAIHHEPESTVPGFVESASRRTTGCSSERLDADGLPYLIAAHLDRDRRPRGHFDGKLEAPVVLERAAAPEEIRRLSAAGEYRASQGVLAAWDFSIGIPTARVVDCGANSWHADLVNMPTRAVTGHLWSGQAYDWRLAPAEYAAIHFHADDLEDAGWESDVGIKLPELESGVYALRLETESGATDRVPFLVRSREPKAAVAVWLPTFTYLAYAGERIVPPFDPVIESEDDHYVAATGLLSQYNRHEDGSGVVHASRLRPLPSLRPSYRYWLTGAPHGLGADLYLLDWLRHERVPHDLIVDEDVHEHGDDLLGRYRTVLTGSHPEYTTHSQMRALDGYLGAGGRLMYLGGNGFTMVTGVHPERDHVTEVRRSLGHADLWESEPGEGRLAATGEPGGRWSQRKETPRALVGVESVGMGFCGATFYKRQADSFDPRAAFVFEGIGDDEAIGDFGLGFGGAAGYEVDGLDPLLGSPDHALVLARARGFQDYVPLTSDPFIRADMVLFETPGNGFVFSVGSISWTSALSHSRYQNNVARITKNVLDRFLVA